jgi:hypothetical protein
MRDAILEYFSGEKHAALALLAASLLALLVTALLLSPRWGLRSLGFTLAAFALILAAIGAGLYLRTGPQLEQLLAQLGASPSSFLSPELSRMLRVQRNFVWIELGELLVIGLSAALAFWFKERAAIVGVALGFLLNAAFLLSFDLVAERRGARYLAALQSER